MEDCLVSVLKYAGIPYIDKKGGKINLSSVKIMEDEIRNFDQIYNHMTVPAAVRKLEKIELIRQSDRGYRMYYGEKRYSDRRKDRSTIRNEEVMRFLSGNEVDDE